jgi:hypothetical protein
VDASIGDKEFDVGDKFEFIFAPDTFLDNEGSLTYSA